mmetsp:Transcript_714/g.1290  ORF Transcript_714/g.1290 Transcript_714/m.1290 type:complete len:296 (-) Transcript_714:135-1022(-)
MPVATLCAVLLAFTACVPFAAADNASCTEEVSALQLEAPHEHAVGSRLVILEAAREKESKARHYIFYVNLPENRKHPVELYKTFLEFACRHYSARGIPFGVVGDLDSVAKMAKECTPYMHGHQLSTVDLSHEDTIKKLPKEEDKQCTLKFGGPTLQGNLVKIWLNKLPVLCSLAMEQPDNVTTLSDVIADVGLMDWVVNDGWQELQPGRLGTRQYRHREKSRLFSNRRCSDVVVVWAKYLAVRGRDCPRIMAAYNETLARLGNETNGCPCFDEEWALTRLQRETPDLIQLQGPPR